jgi:hypothetical protein
LQKPEAWLRRMTAHQAVIPACVAGFNWNGWRVWSGMSGAFGLESVAVLEWNTQLTSYLPDMYFWMMNDPRLKGEFVSTDHRRNF